MSVGPVPVFQPSTSIQVGEGELRVRQMPIPTLGSGSTGESKPTQPAPVVTAIPQDAVKVQLKPPGEIAVYQFVDRQGTVVLQVPPQPLLELAQQISQELARKPLSQTPSEGGKHNGH